MTRAEGMLAQKGKRWVCQELPPKKERQMIAQRMDCPLLGSGGKWPGALDALHSQLQRLPLR